MPFDNKTLSALERAHRGAPPEEEKKIEPTALWLALTSLPRPSKDVPLPRKCADSDEPVGYVKMWPLTQEEQMTANAEADRFTKKLLKDPQKKDDANLGYHHTYTNEVAIQVVYLAARDPENVKRPAFPSPGLLRQHLTTDEIGVLFENYCAVQSELGPIRSQMSREEEDALVLRLVEGGSHFPLDSFSWELRRTLLISLASRLANCWTAMSSAGLQPEVATYVLQRLIGSKGAEDGDAETNDAETNDAETNDDEADANIDKPDVDTEP